MQSAAYIQTVTALYGRIQWVTLDNVETPYSGMHFAKNVLQFWFFFQWR